jgi:hypothetical protein
VKDETEPSSATRDSASPLLAGLEPRRVRRSIDCPKRADLTWSDRWQADDLGLFSCWETGRELAAREPELAARATAGELVILPWKGGVDRAYRPSSAKSPKPVKSKKSKKPAKKYGAAQYLAMWQGLRGEDLDIEVGVDRRLICSRFAREVIFTWDSKLLAIEASEESDSQSDGKEA